MVSSIVEIVSDLAAQYPRATPEQITEIIVNSIESEPIISDVISCIQVPTKLQIKQAEFRSKRLPKERSKILERIENANFFKKLQFVYVMPIQDSNLMGSIHRDGARVELSFPIKYSNSSYQRLSRTRNLDIDKTYEYIRSTKNTNIENSYSLITKEVPARNMNKTKESPTDNLQEIDEGFDASDLLSLYKIYQVIRIMETSHNQVTIPNKIFGILSNDIKRRNRTYRTNCIGELYQGDKSLPEELQVRHPSSSNISNKIYESLKAIIVHEYKRLHNQYGQQFINNQITYDNYIQTTSRYSVYADKLFSELPD